jgi:CRISPR-associated endonuclease/helicase Cas3
MEFEKIDTRIIGKSRGLPTPYPVIGHLLDTAAIALRLIEDELPGLAKVLLGRNPSDAQRRSVAFSAALHDLGKIGPVFQDQLGILETLMTFGYTDPNALKASSHQHVTQLTLPEALLSSGILGDLGDELSGQLGLACSLGGHHGLFNSVLRCEKSQSGRTDLGTREARDIGSGRWLSQRVAHVKFLATTLKIDAPYYPTNPQQAVALCGFTVLSDWIASQEHVIAVGQSGAGANNEWETHFNDQYRLSHETVRLTGVRIAKPRPGSFSTIFGFEARPLQESLNTHFQTANKTGILIVTSPMGVGKTEAALDVARLVGPDRGIYFALPTMGTADAMFSRLETYAAKAFLGGEVSLGLAHSMRMLSEAFQELPDVTPTAANDEELVEFPEGQTNISDDDEVSIVAADWLRGRGRVLLAPIAAGTIDQLLAGALRMKRGSLRWAAFASKVVIIDEAHALDAHMHGLLCVALNWLGALQVPVIILSATLPTRITRELIDSWRQGAGLKELPTPIEPIYPGWVYADNTDNADQTGNVTIQHAESPNSTLKITLHAYHIDEGGASGAASAVTDELHAVSTDFGTALVICNTVKDAQQLFTELKPWAQQHNVDLLNLHSRMPHADRRNRLSDVFARYGKPGPTTTRPHRGVLIATQIVEQSLDVDFDVVISFLAPIAPMLQRAGRGHRHDHVRPPGLQEPHLVVMVPVSPNNDEIKLPKSWTYVYPTTYLKRTYDLLVEPQTQALQIPQDVQRVVDHVYGTTGEMEKPDIDPELANQLQKEWIAATGEGETKIPTPLHLSQLDQLSHDADEDLVLATRTGIDSQLVICVYTGQNGPTLTNTTNSKPLPQKLNRFTTKAIIDRGVPLPRDHEFVRKLRGRTQTPTPWSKSPWLHKAILLELDENSHAEIGNWTATLNPETGLHLDKN